MYCGLATLGLLLSSVPVAYALARLRWRGRQVAFLIVLATMMLPQQVTVVPLYVMWSKLGLVGTLWPVILVTWFGDAFSIFLLRQFFLTIPQEYIDAARVDGCGEFRILTTVVLRLAKPAIAAVALFSVLYCFNDYFLPAAVRRAGRDADLAGLDRPVAVPQPAPGAVEPHHGGDAARDVAGDRHLLPRPEGVRRGHHADGGQGMKIAVVGGGSTYTPELVSCLQREGLDVGELVLHDIDAGRLGRGRRTGGADAGPAGVPRRAGAHRRPGPRARRRRLRAPADPRRRPGRTAGDETVPLRSGCIGQETTGAGGFAKALRTVPVVLRIAERAAERAAPGAWIIDFTNPVGIVTRALLDAGHRAIGLCNVAITFQRLFARLLGVEPERIVVDQVGLNHLTWIRAVRLDGTDVLPRLLDAHAEALAAEVQLPRRLLEELGAIPSYYLRYYYATREVLAEQLTGEPRAAAVARMESELLHLYRDPGLAEKPALLEGRGGAFYSEAATGLVASLAGGNGDVHIVNVRNAGAIAGLADDDVVELPARVDSAGATPLAQAPLAPELLGLVQHVAAYDRLAVEAAVGGDRAVARKALIAHPLIGQFSLAEELLERLLEAGAAYLPQFRREAAV